MVDIKGSHHFFPETKTSRKKQWGNGATWMNSMRFVQKMGPYYSSKWSCKWPSKCWGLFHPRRWSYFTLLITGDFRVQSLWDVLWGIARDGLDYLHSSMQFCRGGKAMPLKDAMEQFQDEFKHPKSRLEKNRDSLQRFHDIGIGEISIKLDVQIFHVGIWRTLFSVFPVGAFLGKRCEGRFGLGHGLPSPPRPWKWMVGSYDCFLLGRLGLFSGVLLVTLPGSV